MKKVMVLILILLLPAYSYAAYKIYLKNGSVISGASSYEERGEEVDIYFSTGSMSIPKKDVLKIEGKEEPAKETITREKPETEQKKGKTEEATAPSQVSESASDKSARANELRAELDSVNSEIKAADENEARLVSTINEKTGRRFNYNLIQLKQLEKELDPLRQELRDVQQKKQELIQKKSSIETELKSLE